MRRVVLRMSVTLDGFVCGPNGEIDWLMRNRAADSSAWVLESLHNAGVHAMGSRTFLGMVNFWPAATVPMAAAMNDIPKVVFTRQASFDRHAGDSAAAASWASARIANGDLAAEIARLKNEPGKDILVHGGAHFARSLTTLGLIDEYRLLISPVVLGGGLRLFPELPQQIDLKLVDTTVFLSGAVAHVYRKSDA